jgi:hypothetical protein
MYESLGARVCARWLTALGLVLAVGAPAAAADRVVLISWDGIRRDVLQDLLHWQNVNEVPQECPNAKHPMTLPTVCNGYLTCLPNICQFQITDSRVAEGKPLTKPQHAQMLTGYGPPETGDITNSGKNGVPPGYTIYERIDAARPEVATVHIGGRKFIGRSVTRWASRFGALDLDLRRGGRDGYTGDNTTDQVVVGLDFVGTSPFFMFIHYKAADVVAHRSGDAGQQYREAIIENDRQLGDVLQMLSQRGLLSTSQVFVTTDHGFSGIFHVNAELPQIAETWFASSSPILSGSPATTVLDVTPTILDVLGVDGSAADPPYRGQSRLVP